MSDGESIVRGPRIREIPPGESRARLLCPECGYIGAESKFTKARGEYRRCIKCANEWDVAPSPPEAVAV